MGGTNRYSIGNEIRDARADGEVDACEAYGCVACELEGLGMRSSLGAGTIREGRENEPG